MVLIWNHLSKIMSSRKILSNNLPCLGHDRGSVGENLNSVVSTKDNKTSKHDKNKRIDHIESKIKEFEDLKAKYPFILEGMI